jgi:hypothetical protein
MQSDPQWNKTTVLQNPPEQHFKPLKPLEIADISATCEFSPKGRKHMYVNKSVKRQGQKNLTKTASHFSKTLIFQAFQRF